MKSYLLLTGAVLLLSLCLTLGIMAQTDEWEATLTATSNNAEEAPDYKSSSLLLAVNEKATFNYSVLMEAT